MELNQDLQNDGLQDISIAKMIFLGIDNGLNGGLASYDGNTGQINVTAMPIVTMVGAKGNKNEYDIPAIRQWIMDLGVPVERAMDPVKMVILERAHAFPGMSAQSTFANGRNVGIMEGLLSALGLPYTIVHSKTWQKKFFEGISHNDTKQASILVAKRTFPTVSFKPTEISKKDSDGMTDAVLMAYYGYLMHK